jgi:hypothetical protein
MPLQRNKKPSKWLVTLRRAARLEDTRKEDIANMNTTSLPPQETTNSLLQRIRSTPAEQPHKKQLLIHVDLEAHKRLKEFCFANGVTIKALMLEGLRRVMEDIDKEKENSLSK